MFLSNSASYVDNNNSDTTLLNHEFPNFVAKRYNAKVFHILGLPIEVKNNASYENQCEWYMDSVVEIHGRDKSYCFSNRWFTQNIANWTNLFEIYGYLDISSKSSLPRHILEIGSFEGQSATFFVKNIISQHNESELFVIDTFKGSARDVLSDAINSFPMLKINGLMIFDDYLRISGANDPYNDAKKGVDAFLQFYGSKTSNSTEWALFFTGIEQILSFTLYRLARPDNRIATVVLS
eukprot:gene1743-3366_t